ncbi:MAG: TonB-dependent receptor plug domain-containing protein, partial [Candidatus Latescibacterota bacterium]
MTQLVSTEGTSYMGEMTMIRIARSIVVSTWLAAAAVAGAADLEGSITDADGLALPGANITVTGGGLDRAFAAVSAASGNYVVPGLAAGSYDVRITHIGFRTSTSTGVRVDASGATLNITLERVLLDLEMSVVSASRTQEKALDAPASISVIDADDIATRAVLSVSGLVRDQPGVDFAQTGLVQSNIVTRGFNNIFSGALLTLTDNRIANVPSLRVNVHNFIPVTNEDIERIEVVLGPGAALYGPNSANGVLHIISKSPFQSAGNSLTIGGGERGLVKGFFRHARVVNPQIAYKISLQYYTGEDWKYHDPVEAAARQAALDVARRGHGVGWLAGASGDDLLIGARDFDVQRQSLEFRGDFKPTEDLTAIFSYGYNQGDHIEMTGIGAG